MSERLSQSLPYGIGVVCPSPSCVIYQVYVCCFLFLLPFLLYFVSSVPIRYYTVNSSIVQVQDEPRLESMLSSGEPFRKPTIRTIILIIYNVLYPTSFRKKLLHFVVGGCSSVRWTNTSSHSALVRCDAARRCLPGYGRGNRQSHQEEEAQRRPPRPTRSYRKHHVHA